MKKYDMKLLLKLCLIIVGILLLVYLMWGKDASGHQAPEGEKITREDVKILLDALELPEISFDFLHYDTRGAEGSITGNMLTYGEYQELYQLLEGAKIGLPEYTRKYVPEDSLLKEDWYTSYEQILAYYQREKSVWKTTVFLLKVDTEAKSAYTETGAMQGVFSYCSEAFDDKEFQELTVYIQNNTLLTVVEVMPKEHYLGNVWVMECGEEGLECFYHQISFQIPWSEDKKAKLQKTLKREQVADLTLSQGCVIAAKPKEEKVHGKLLRVSEQELELEGQGTFFLAEDLEIYRLYGSLTTLTKESLKIGYEDTDYVLENGKICAALVSREQDADNIRVLLKNTAKCSNYYDNLTLTMDGTSIALQADSLEEGERRIYRSENLTDTIILEAPGIEKEDNAYRGTIECYKEKEGLVLINELPLEEYLYAVVPSEMPASYPMEALKAQAICARTYGYRFILSAGLPEYGAHVDDTTAYQVYHNCKEHVATTTAVKETKGILLTYQDEPAQNYYYSTSCGSGTDASIWKSGKQEDLSYLQPTGARAEELQEEADFAEFIKGTDAEDLEAEEPWYRWRYVVKKMDSAAILERMQERYQVSPEAVLTKTEGDYYVAEPITDSSAIQELSVGKRGIGGVVDELLVVTGQGSYKIVAEYNIRYILCDRQTEVVRQDNTTIAPKMLLPSGFFVIETSKKGENVVGYTLIGGGYGHGVGMSQNGARALGKKGADYRQILETYFPGCSLTQGDV